MYKAVVQEPNLADVRAVVRRCLNGISQAKQLEMLTELCDWIEGQICDLEQGDEETETLSETETTLLSAMEEQVAAGATA